MASELSREAILAAMQIHVEADLAFGLDRVPGPDRTADRSSDPAPVVEQGPKETLARLQQEAEACKACGLHQERNCLVFGAGDPRAALLFVGEGPGAEEDRTGLPFVGKAGHLLTKMIEAMGFTRDQVYIANTVKCRPPGNRTPTPMETNACAAFLEAQIRTIAPRVIVALGAAAARTLLTSEGGIGALRGRSFPYEKQPEITIIPTFHPAYLLRNASEKGKAWVDLQKAMSLLKK